MYKKNLHMYKKKKCKNLYIDPHENPWIKNRRVENAHV